MSYPTTAYPEFRTLEPKVLANDDYSEFVQKTARAVKDTFDWRHDIDRPEYGAIGYVKSNAVNTAIAIDEKCDEATIGEMATLLGGRIAELAEERGVEDIEIEPQDIAVAAYASVTTFDWALGESSMAEPNTFVLLHDSVRDLSQIGTEVR